MGAPHILRLVRVQDFAGSAGTPVWEFNPRTGQLVARAGLSWTGVRTYQTQSGPIRVLRRPEQVNAPGHIATLRGLPATDGHPAGDVDVDPTNRDALEVGRVGDDIAIAEAGGYSRPVGRVYVGRPSTMVKMVGADAWRDICEKCSGLRDVVHGGHAPHSGTSLGYNAIWHSPYITAEIVRERDNGALVGAWQGPRGEEEYDVEHIVDPTCEIVLRLVRETGFNAEELGGNHFAIALEAMGGRGGAQSELMRIVDGRDLAPLPDAARAASQVSVPVPRAQDAAEWTVGASRDLPVASGEWDGDAAKASVFAWAGFDGDAPDPAKARQAFLIYDANEPELKGSYKLPIARVREGRLEAVDAGLRAAASRLPQTDAPQEVLDRARAVLDGYFKKLDEDTKDKSSAKERMGVKNESASRRSNANINTNRRSGFTKDTHMELEIGISRDDHERFAKNGVINKLAARGIHIPTRGTYTFAPAEDMDMSAMQGKLKELQALVGALMQASGEDMEEAEDMSAKMEDMKSAEEIEKMIAAKAGEIDELKKQLAEASKDMGKMKADRDGLLAEIQPMRAEQLSKLRTAALDIGCDEETVKACTDAKEVRRAIAVLRDPDAYGATKNVRDSKGAEGKQWCISDEVVEGFVNGVLSARKEAPPADPIPAPARGRDHADPFEQVPTPAPARGRDKKDAPTPPAVAQLDAALAMLG